MVSLQFRLIRCLCCPSDTLFPLQRTSSKINKINFMEQMGFWYFDPKCNGKTLSEIGGNANKCCLAEPAFKCHFRDKPSIEPCKDSPAIDGDHPSFW